MSWRQLQAIRNKQATAETMCQAARNAARALPPGTRAYQQAIVCRETAGAEASRLAIIANRLETRLRNNMPT